jgi:hypothetical protein
MNALLSPGGEPSLDASTTKDLSGPEMIELVRLVSDSCCASGVAAYAKAPVDPDPPPTVTDWATAPP